jgi:hypothetical protein
MTMTMTVMMRERAAEVIFLVQSVYNVYKSHGFVITTAEAMELLDGPGFVKHASRDGSDVCAVCLDELNARAEVILPCNHAYHADCYVALVKSRVSQSQSQSQSQNQSQSQSQENRGGASTHALACPMCRKTLLHVHVAQGMHAPPGDTVVDDEDDEDLHQPNVGNALTIMALCSSMGLIAYLAWAVLNQGSYGEV